MSLLISSGCVCCWLVSRSISLLGFENLGLKTKDYSFLLGCKHLPEEQHGAWAAKHRGSQPEWLSGVWGGEISRRTVLHPTLPARLSPVLAVLGISVSWWCHGVVGYRLASPCLRGGRCGREKSIVAVPELYYKEQILFPRAFGALVAVFFPPFLSFCSRTTHFPTKEPVPSLPMPEVGRGAQHLLLALRGSHVAVAPLSHTLVMRGEVSWLLSWGRGVSTAFLHTLTLTDSLLPLPPQLTSTGRAGRVSKGLFLLEHGDHPRVLLSSFPDPHVPLVTVARKCILESERLGLEGTTKITQCHPPATCRDVTPRSGCSGPHPTWS